jgi:hypothetical protein
MPLDPPSAQNFVSNIQYLLQDAVLKCALDKSNAFGDLRQLTTLIDDK